MNSVRCVNNKAYVRVPDEAANGPLADLTLGAVYKALPTPQSERDAGLLRIIDNAGEDYLYPATDFQPLDWAVAWGAGHTALTIHLAPRTKAMLRAEALVAHPSMGALMRQWSEERLELQSRQEAARSSLSPVPPRTGSEAGGGEIQSSLAVPGGDGGMESYTQPNKALQLTASSVRSAPASGSS